MIKLSQSHYLAFKKAINESLPWAKVDGIEIDPIIQFVDAPPSYTENNQFPEKMIDINLDKDLIENLILVLEYHPEEEVSKYFIEDLKTLRKL